MMDTAYRTTDPAVLAEWEKFRDAHDETRVKRDAMSAAVGRGLYMNRGSGFGSTRVVGFERFDSDTDGDLIHHGGCLIVSSERGQHHGLIVPNIRRKAGKAFAEELAGLTNPPLTVPGMSTFHMCTKFGRIYASGPAFSVWGGAAYALWTCDDAPVDETIWERVPLSVYHAAKEQHEPEQSTTNEETDDAH